MAGAACIAGPPDHRLVVSEYLMNRAPKLATIGIAVVLIIVGALGTFAGILPERVGIWSYVLATVVLMLGVLFKRI